MGGGGAREGVVVVVGLPMRDEDAVDSGSGEEDAETEDVRVKEQRLRDKMERAKGGQRITFGAISMQEDEEGEEEGQDEDQDEDAGLETHADVVLDGIEVDGVCVCVCMLL